MPDHAMDSILDAWDLPVNQEADGTSAQFEIGKQLGSMDGMDHKLFSLRFAVQNSKNQSTQFISIL
jgi:hypothetical protein